MQNVSFARRLRFNYQHFVCIHARKQPMTTLHALRRSCALSFSDLAVVTAIPVRHLAAFEYQGYPLAQEERRSLAAFFGIAETALEAGMVTRVPAQPTLTPAQAKALALLAATVALTWSLRLNRPFSPPSVSTASSIFAPLAAVAPGKLFAAEPSATPTPTPTATATATPTPTATATAAATATITATTTPTATATATPTPEPTLTPTLAPTLTPTQAPTVTPRPIQSARLAPQAAPQLAIATDNIGDPHRCPLLPQAGRVVITQGYGVGTHAPAELWGGVDLAVGSGSTEGTPVVASHAGVVQVALNSWPGGNFVSVSSDTGWRTAYAHLQSVSVQSGQYVEAGTIIGTAGSTGNSTGPHLHFETWHNGVNVDPSPVLNCR
jgi:murein DD-endopeptidase MepM/ murein hydrolase activator NlpD